MDNELQALEDNGTWSITSFPTNKHPIGCNWMQMGIQGKHREDGKIGVLPGYASEIRKKCASTN